MRSTVEGSSALAVAGRRVSLNSATSPRSVHGPTVSSRPSLDEQIEATFLDHVSAVGLIAALEQHFAAVDVTGLGADRQNAQRLATQAD